MAKPMTAAELSEAAYRKPVTDVPAPDAETIAGAYLIEHDGYGPGDAYGVIVRKTDPFGGPGEAYKIERCSTAEYRDETLLPFFGFYDSTLRLERFGPDLDARAADARPTGECQWFAGCLKVATDYRPHPVLDRVPVCPEHLVWKP